MELVPSPFYNLRQKSRMELISFTVTQTGPFSNIVAKVVPSLSVAYKRGIGGSQELHLK